MKSHQAKKVLSSTRRGSSWPLIVETAEGNYYVKLIGTGHGALALVAEVLVASLAEAIGLRVPARAEIQIGNDLACENRDPELLELLTASKGTNLGLQVVDDARDLRAEDIENISSDDAACIVWLDWLVMNPDRTPQNPNMLICKGKLWLIDHGSSLIFHHDWPGVTESSPTRPWLSVNLHVLGNQAEHLMEWDSILSDKITREIIRDAVQEIPDAFLRPLLMTNSDQISIKRRREAYLAFLWKRLKSRRLSDLMN